MKYSELKIINEISAILSGLFIVGCIVAYVYPDKNYFGITIFPYRNYAIPLAIAGTVLFVIGFVLRQHTKEGTESLQTQQPVSDMGYCPYCGTPYAKDYKFCKKCGKARAT
jgi:hypothetical protein